MNFTKIFFFIFAIFLVSSVDARWKVFKKIEKVGRNVRNGIIKAGPAVGVVGQAAAIAKGK